MMGTVMAAISFALKASYWLFQERRDVAPLRPQTFSAHLCIFMPFVLGVAFEIMSILYFVV